MNEGGTMNEAEIDRVLSRQDEILPSSGFTASVMEAVRRETAVPPPIAFPWKRALPLVVIAALAVLLASVGGVALVVLASRGAIPAPVSTFSPLPMSQAIHSTVFWTAVSLLAAFVSVKLSMRVATGRT